MSLGEAMRQMIEEAQMGARLDEQKAIEAWPLVVGVAIARSGPRPTVRAGVMTVRLYNAALRQDLSMQRSRLVAAINSLIGRPTLSDIRFTS